MQLKTLLITVILAIIFLFFLLLNEFNLLSKKNGWELKNNTDFDSIVVLTGKFDRIKKDSNCWKLIIPKKCSFLELIQS